MDLVYFSPVVIVRISSTDDLSLATGYDPVEMKYKYNVFHYFHFYICRKLILNCEIKI